MKIRLGLILSMLVLGASCAPGYYETGADYQIPTYWEEKTWYQNPETEEEYRMRIWRMESDRGG